MLYENLARVRKSSSQVKDQSHKKSKSFEISLLIAESSPLTMHSTDSRTCAVARPYVTRNNRRHHCVSPEGDGYAGGKISACYLVEVYNKF